MKKNKKTIKLVSLIFAILGVIGIILTLVIPGRVYEGKIESSHVKVETRIILDGKNYKMSTKVNGQWTDPITVGEYKIKGGSIIVNGIDIDTKINGLTMKNGDEKLTSKLSLTFFIISCVVALAGVSCYMYCLLTSNNSKRKTKKK